MQWFAVCHRRTAYAMLLKVLLGMIIKTMSNHINQSQALCFGRRYRPLRDETTLTKIQNMNDSETPEQNVCLH